ncbi:MAG: hypothetical protein ACE5IJ_06995, partial [Thermoplasmata archaeon]
MRAEMASSRGFEGTESLGLIARIVPPFLAFLSAFSLGALHTVTYFRNDDFEWLLLGKTFADAPWIPFVDASAQVAGFYRPVVALSWILGYRLWGADSTGYALLLSAIFGLTSLAFYSLVAFLQDRPTGLVSALILATFFPTIITMWWRSLFTSGIGLLL